jgi:hypothetical protein
MFKNDREIAYNILLALSESSLSDELKYYRDEVQRDLLLSRDQMDRLYTIEGLARALKPEPEAVRYYKGRKVDGCFLSFQTITTEVANVPEVEVANVPEVEVANVPEVEVTVPKSTKSSTEAVTRMDIILQELGVDTDTVRYEADKYVHIMIVYGLDNYTQHYPYFSSMGGRWKPKFGGWAFNKAKVARFSVTRRDSDEIDDPEKDESD